MNIRLDLDPTAWRRDSAIDPQHRDRKRHLSREGCIRLAVAVLAFAAGLAL